MLLSRIFRLCLALALVPLAVAPFLRAGAPSSPQNQRAKPVGWSGVVTFTKTLHDELHSDEPVRGKLDAQRNRVVQHMTRSYEYRGRAVVVDAMGPAPHTESSVILRDEDRTTGRQTVYDTCGWGPEHAFVDASTDERTTRGVASGPVEGLNITVDETSGTYRLSFRFPAGKGIWEHEYHLTRTGYCQEKNNQPADVSESKDTRVGGEAVSIEGKLDPKAPDVLRGANTWDTSSGKVKSFMYTVTWNLRRDPDRVMITDLHFEHPVYPDWDNWEPISQATGTIDGNPVKIKATVINLSPEPKNAVVKLTESHRDDAFSFGGKVISRSRPDVPIPQGQVSVALEPGEERTVEVALDTQGWAWFDNSPGSPLGESPTVRAELEYRIRADLEVEGGVRDTRTERLVVAPKPLVLLHGLWSSPEAFLPLFRNAMSGQWGYQWKAYAVGEQPRHGQLQMGTLFGDDPGQTISNNTVQAAQYIEYARKDSNAWHIDLVGHTTGGLVGRRYIHSVMGNAPDGKPVVAHFVMLGTPNLGMPCASVMNLGHDVFGEQVRILEELTPDAMADFNRRYSDRRGVLFSALAGYAQPISCGKPTWNDMLVPVDSALAGAEDRKLINATSEELARARGFQFALTRVAVAREGEHPRKPENLEPDWEEALRVHETTSVPPPSPLDAFRWAVLQTAAADLPRVRFVGTSEPASRPKGSFQKVALSKNETVTVDLPVQPAPSFSVTLLAPPEVSFTLLNDTGETMGTNLAGTAAASAFFRTVTFPNAVARAATWKLRIENTGRKQVTALVAVSTDRENPPLRRPEKRTSQAPL